MKSKINFLVILLLFLPIFTPAQTMTLQGKWRFLTLKENGVNISLPDSSKNQSMRFNKYGKLFSSITCNNFSGKFSLAKQRRIKISSLITTAKGCFGKEGEIERSFASILMKTTSYQIEGGVLTLRDASGMNVVTLIKSNEPEQIIPIDWEHFEECGFTFYAPSTLKAKKPGQIDSCSADLEDKDLRISITYGKYGKRFGKSESMTEFKEEITDIDGKKTQLVTYIYNFRDSKNKLLRNYVSGIYVSLTASANEAETMTSLVMTIESKRKKDLATAKQIFKTIKFQ